MCVPTGWMLVGNQKKLSLKQQREVESDGGVVSVVDVGRGRRRSATGEKTVQHPHGQTIEEESGGGSWKRKHFALTLSLSTAHPQNRKLTLICSRFAHAEPLHTYIFFQDIQQSKETSSVFEMLNAGVVNEDLQLIRVGKRIQRIQLLLYKQIYIYRESTLLLLFFFGRKKNREKAHSF